MPGPIAACVSHGATQLVLQKLLEVAHVLVPREGRQATRIHLQLLDQFQAAEGHGTMVGGRVDTEVEIGTSLAVLNKIRE